MAWIKKLWNITTWIRKSAWHVAYDFQTKLSVVFNYNSYSKLANTCHWPMAKISEMTVSNTWDWLSVAGAQRLCWKQPNFQFVGAELKLTICADWKLTCAFPSSIYTAMNWNIHTVIKTQLVSLVISFPFINLFENSSVCLSLECRVSES